MKMDLSQITLGKIREAQASIRPVLHRTPIFSSRYLSEQLGAEIHLKAELFQKTGSFKPRGAINKLRQFTAEEKSRGVVTVSAGNHAQAVAFASSMEKLSCVVVMPSSAPSIKLEATRGYGADVVLHDDMRTIFEKCEEVQKQHNSIFLPPFDDPHVICGQGTIGLEILEDLQGVDLVVAGIGGGGVISGIAFALKSLNPRVQVIGVEPEGAPAMTRALSEGKPVRLDKIETVADGLAAPYVGQWNLEMVQKYVDDIVIVSDNEILAAVRMLLQRTKLAAEPAGAAGVAALLAGKIPCAGKCVVPVLTGGNLNLRLL